MIIVDTHCHALPHWFEPVEILLQQMHANGVEHATLVQVRGQCDNRYLMECVQRFPGRFSPVIMVDTDKPDAPETLSRWVRDGAEGIRLGPTTRSPGADPLAIWRRAAELQIPVSSLSTPEGFTSPHFEQVIKEFPSLPIIIEHLGGIGRDEAPPYAKFRQILALAQYPNTYIKIHRLGGNLSSPHPLSGAHAFPAHSPLHGNGL
jgi:L-fuconolactonase